MSPQPPRSDDPLAALAKAAEREVHSDEASRAAGLAAREAAAGGRRRFVRAASYIALSAILAATLAVQVPRIVDPYHGVDPLSDPRQASAYLAGLLDAVWDWRARNHGELPVSLDQAVPQHRLPPPASAYQVDYRVEDGVPVLTLQGGAQQLVVRGVR